MDTMCSQSFTELVAITVRVVAFFLSLSLLPYFLFPLLIRLMLAAGLIMLSLPVANCSLYYFFSVPLVIPQAQALTSEAGVGILLGILVSGAGYVAGLLSNWIEGLYSTGSPNRNYRNSFYRSDKIPGSPLTFAFSLVVVTILLSSTEVSLALTHLVLSVGKLTGNEVLITTTADNRTVELTTLILALGKDSLRLGFYCVVPFLVLSLAIDAIFSIVQRFMRNLAVPQVLLSTKMPLLLLLAAMMLYPLAGKFVEAFVASTTLVEHAAANSESGLASSAKVDSDVR